jgi:hypothetical protein
MARIKDHIKTLAECMGDHAKAMSECHGSAAEDAEGSVRDFHKAASASYSDMADKCEKVSQECGKADDPDDLEKITPVEKALLARLAKSVIPDGVRATGTRENPNRAIGRAGDPPPQTQDTEIPQEFIDVFQV